MRRVSASNFGSRNTDEIEIICSVVGLTEEFESQQESVDHKLLALDERMRVSAASFD